MAGQLTLRRPFADHSSLHPCPPPSSTVSLSLLFSDSDFYISSKRTNGGTSITGSIGSSPSGNGLHPLAYRRKRKKATEKGRSGVLLPLLLILAAPQTDDSPCPFQPHPALPPAHLVLGQAGEGWPIAPSAVAWTSKAGSTSPAARAQHHSRF